MGKLQMLAATVVVLALAAGAALFLKYGSQREYSEHSVAGVDAGSGQTVERDQPIVARAELDRLREENERLRLEREQLVAAKDSLTRERDQLAAAKEALAGERDQLAVENAKVTLEKENLANMAAAPPAESFAEPAADKEGGPLRVQFGDSARAEALSKLDMAKVSKATRALTEIGVLLKGTDGEEAQGEVWKRIGGDYKRARRELNLAGFALRGQLPTSMPQGEATHPLVLSNIVAETLEQNGTPLDDGQVSQVELLGEDYERAWQRAQAGYDENAIALARILDELELRRNFSESLDALLNPDQLAALGPEEIRHVAHLDFHSVSLALGEVSRLLFFAPPETIRAKLEEVARSWGIGDEQLSSIAFALDEWASAETPPPVPPSETKFYELDVAIAAGRVQQRAMETIARVLAHDEEVLESVRTTERFCVPRQAPPGWGGGREK
ncbi:hypothetical protein ACFL59_05780 [Planctomycetota bacterium]